MNQISITLPGSPVSANHMWRSSVSKSGRPFTYMPQKEKDIREFWRLTATGQMRKQGRAMSKSEVGMDVTFYFESKARRDIDNYLKVAIDSMKGVVYEDDSQVMSLRATKAYDPENPRTEIIIRI